MIMVSAPWWNLYDIFFILFQEHFGYGWRNCFLKNKGLREHPYIIYRSMATCVVWRMCTGGARSLRGSVHRTCVALETTSSILFGFLLSRSIRYTKNMRLCTSSPWSTAWLTTTTTGWSLVSWGGGACNRQVCLRIALPEAHFKVTMTIYTHFEVAVLRQQHREQIKPPIWPTKEKQLLTMHRCKLNPCQQLTIISIFRSWRTKKTPYLSFNSLQFKILVRNKKQWLSLCLGFSVVALAPFPAMDMRSTYSYASMLCSFGVL